MESTLVIDKFTEAMNLYEKRYRLALLEQCAKVMNTRWKKSVIYAIQTVNLLIAYFLWHPFYYVFMATIGVGMVIGVASVIFRRRLKEAIDNAIIHVNVSCDAALTIVGAHMILQILKRYTQWLN